MLFEVGGTVDQMQDSRDAGRAVGRAELSERWVGGGLSAALRHTGCRDDEGRKVGVSAGPVAIERRTWNTQSRVRTP